ncbi:MAG TPA: ABC transporter permease, partial [Acetobacteraceae bacterium]|nr:ABC transporter permease [Acetobacteraceae bacterium]
GTPPPGQAAAAQPAAEPARPAARPRIDPVNLRLLGLLALLVVVFWAVIGPKVLALPTLQSMAFQMPELGILSLAMMVTLLSGGLDLSIIATADLCALTIAYVLTTHAGASGLGFVAWQVLAVAAGVAVALVIGLLNGLIVAYVGVSPILVTLGTMTLVRGAAVGLTHGNVLSGFPPWLLYIGNGTPLGIPAPLIVFAVIAIPVAVMLTRSPLGISIAMIGSNERASRFSGIDTRRVLLKVYLLSSLLASAAALVMMARFNSANADYGQSFLLVTILAAVLGGVDPMGGFGKVGGVVLALVVLQFISSAFNLLGISQFLTLAIWGGVLIAAGGLPMLRGLWEVARPGRGQG